MLFELPRHPGARSCALAIPLFLGLFAPACLVDLDDRCGRHQRYDADQANCVCETAYALVGTECVACAENEVGSADGCVCVEGYARPTPSAACETLAGLGQDCTSDETCGDERYPSCRIEPDADSGYCTSVNCSTSADCPTNFGCNTRTAPSFCEKPPSGLGEACSSSSECAGFAAPYCETVVAHSCVVNDCAPDPNKCHGDWLCCDIGLLSQSLCIPPDELEDGNCPAGGTLIPRQE